MKTHEPPAWFLPVSLLTIIILLSTVPAFADPHGSMPRHSKTMHSSSGSHGSSGHEGYGDHSRSSHHDGMNKRHGGGRHSKGHGGHGYGSTHPGHHRDAIKFIKHILKFKEGMSLTAEQEQQLRALKMNYKKTRIKAKAEVDLASIDLHEVLKNEKASLSDVEAEFNKFHALKTKLYMASIKAKRDAKAVLSEEQRSRMDKIHERIKSHGGGSMGHPGDYSKYKKSKGYEKHHGDRDHR